MTYAVAAALLLGLTACGGGDDVSAPPPAVGTGRAFNAANATRVAGEVLHGLILPMGEFNSLIEGNFMLNGATTRVDLRTKMLRGAFDRSKFRPQVAVSLSTDCATRGRVKRTVSQEVPGQLTVGDFAVQQYDACVEKKGIEYFGRGREVVTAVNETQSLFSSQGELTGFGISELGTTLLTTGSYNLTTDYSVAQRLKISLWADKAINAERRLNQQTVAAYSFEDLKRTVEFVGDSARYEVSYATKGRFPQLGSLQFQVATQGILELGLDDGTFKGAVKIISNDGSMVLMTFLGDLNVTVRVDLDADGDGTIDQTQSMIIDQLLLPVLVAQ